jgi:hypothetical protein
MVPNPPAAMGDEIWAASFLGLMIINVNPITYR